MNVKIITYLIITVFFWGLAPIFDKIAVNKIDNILTGIFFRNFVVAVLYGIFYIFYCKFNIFDINRDIHGILYFILSGVTAGFLGTIFYFLALKHINASVVVPIAATYPLITLFLSVMLLKENVSFVRLIGVILIISGIWLIRK